MSQLPYANSYRDLLVHQRSRQLARDVYQITLSFPREEMYSLSDQMRRSSRSIGAQIAEAWAKRRYEKHFISKLTDADGEQQETQHWIEIALDCRYLDDNQALSLCSACDEIGRMLNSMISKAHLFCGVPSKEVREFGIEYFTSRENESED